jgi:hypothetical protein
VTRALRVVPACAILLAASLPAPVPAQDLKRPEEQLAAIYALRVQLEIEQKGLDDDLQRHGEVSRKREEARGRLRRLYEDLDAMVEGRADSEPGQIEEREAEVAKVEQEVRALTEEAREIRASIRVAHDRIALLSDRMGRLRRTLPSDNESLTGSWDVSYLPSGDRGAFTLRQSGTLLAGEYALEGGWKGSLQGTIVNGKVLLHRIDSKLGHSQDLEGTLSPEGRTIRGTWQNFILSGGQPATGNWVAQKKERAES